MVSVFGLAQARLVGQQAAAAKEGLEKPSHAIDLVVVETLP
jgi:hypothetical protein